MQILWAGIGRHGGGQQELGQDHQREHGPVRPRLLCVRLEESRGAHRVPPAIQSADDRLGVPDRAGQFCGLPSVCVPGARRRTGTSGSGGHFSAEQPFRPGRGLGSSAAGSPGDDHQQEVEVLRYRRLWRGQGGRDGRPREHGHADLLLCPGQRVAP